MTSLTKTFVISKGGGGIPEISAFVERTVGRNASLIKSISASPINDNSTFFTLEYLTKSEKSIEITNPVNGLISSTRTPPFQYYVQYSDPINTGSLITSGNQILFTGSYINDPSNWYIEPSGNNYILSVDLSEYFTGNGPWSGNKIISFDRSILSYDNTQQNNISLFGFNLVPQASPYIGLENLYSSDLKRGVINIKYALIDTSTSPDLKVKNILSSLTAGGELIAYTTAQKNNNQTELFAILLTQPEPVPSAVYPRLGSMNLDSVQLKQVTIAFKNEINTGQVASQSIFSASKSFGHSIGISPSYITILNNKMIQVDIGSFYTDNSISNSYVSLMLLPGLKSSNSVGGLESTRPYLFPFGTYVSEVFIGSGISGGVVGPTGPVGPPGPSGASGLSGTPGSTGPQGPTGPTGLSGAPGAAGAAGATGPQGPPGTGMLPQATFDNAVVTWSGQSGQFFRNTATSLSTAGVLTTAGNITSSGNVSAGGLTGGVGIIQIGGTSVVRCSVSGTTRFGAGAGNMFFQSGTTTFLSMDGNGNFWPASSAATLGKVGNRFGSTYITSLDAATSIFQNGYQQPRFTFDTVHPTPYQYGDTNYRVDLQEPFYYDYGRNLWVSFDSTTVSAFAPAGNANHYLYPPYNDIGAMSATFGYAFAENVVLTKASLNMSTAPIGVGYLHMMVDGVSKDRIDVNTADTYFADNTFNVQLTPGQVFAMYYSGTCDGAISALAVFRRTET